MEALNRQQQSSNGVVTLSLKKSQSTFLQKTQLKHQSRNGINDIQRQAITMITKELTAEPQTQALNGQPYIQPTVEEVLQRPHVQKLFRDTFQMTDLEIANLESLVVKQCESIIKNKAGRNTTRSQKRIVPSASYGNTQETGEQAKVQPLSMLQRKDLERLLTLDYLQFPVQPCVRSLYYLSKIAQTQSLKIIVPPTVLLGFGDDNRIMYNDYQTGKLVVDAKNISPKKIQNFMQSHMINGPQQQNYSIEDKLLYPKFLIKLATKNSTQNEMKLYYSSQTLFAELLSFWGGYDLALQGFVKSKHPFRPSIYRCYMNKNGNVYKAVAINNQETVNKDSKFYQQLLALISDCNQRSKQAIHHQRQASNKSGSGTNQSMMTGPEETRNLTHFNRPRTSGVNAIEQFFKGQTDRQQLLARKNSFIENLNKRFSIVSLAGNLAKDLVSQDLVSQKPCQLDSRGFPESLEGFKLFDYCNEVQQFMSNQDLKRAFICTTDNIEDLAMMNCRPSALQQAQLMTMDLFRLFSQYFLKIQRYGNVSQFVCDFMEDSNGLFHFLQVKSFECEGILHDWQLPFNPPKLNKGNPLMTQEEIKEIEEEKYMQELYAQCSAKIICKNHQLRDWVVEAAKQNGMWDFPNVKCGQTPIFARKYIEKYKQEIETGKENFCLQSEKSKISSLYPLTCFSDCTPKQPKPPQVDNSYMLSKYMRHSRQRTSILIQSLNYNDLQMTQDKHSSDASTLQPSSSQPEQSGGQDEENAHVCLVCYKILEMFQGRYYALVFKTEQTNEELRKLKLKLIQHWQLENIQFLIKVYRESKRALYIVGDLEKIEKRNLRSQLRDRAKSPESVMKKQTKTNRQRPHTASRNQEKILATQNIDDLFTIQSKTASRITSPNKTSATQASLQKTAITNSKSVVRSVERFQKHINSMLGSEAGKQFQPIPLTHRQKTFRPSTAINLKMKRPFSGAVTFRENQSDHQDNKFHESQQKETSQQASALKIIEQAPYEDPIINIQTPKSLKKSASTNIFKMYKRVGPISLNFKLRNVPSSDCLHSKTQDQGFSVPSHRIKTAQDLSLHHSNMISKAAAIKNSQPSGTVMSMLQSASQKSDKQVAEYFNNKRIINRIDASPRDLRLARFKKLQVKIYNDDDDDDK